MSQQTIPHFIHGERTAGDGARTADVFEPATGRVQARVALASPGEVTRAVDSAERAFGEWSALNAQRRGRILLTWVDLINEHLAELATLLSKEHGKTFPDAKGDVQRGVEVVEFAAGAPHLLKGEFTTSAGTGIDVHSLRQPLGVVAGITPFNFPAMIPLWKAGIALAAGNTVVLKPSERDPSVPVRLAELALEAGMPPGTLNVVHGDKTAVSALIDDPRVQAVGFVGSTPIARSIYEHAARRGICAQCFGGAKNHAVIMPDADLEMAADALIGAAFGSAGERCMAISVAVPVGEETADRLVALLRERMAGLTVGPSLEESSDFGPVVSQDAKEQIEGLIQAGVDEGAELVVDGRGVTVPGHEGGFYVGATCSTASPRTCGSTARRSSAPCCVWSARRTTRPPWPCRTTTSTATASRSSPATGTRPATSPPGCSAAWSASTCRSPCRSPTTRSAAGRRPASATSTSTARTA